MTTEILKELTTIDTAKVKNKKSSAMGQKVETQRTETVMLECITNRKNLMSQALPSIWQDMQWMSEVELL